MEAGGTQHKSWTPHISMWILFRHVARYGDLWRFSSGALEQRGAQLKRIGSCVACFRPRVAAKGRTAEGKKVTKHNSSAQHNIFQINNASVSAEIGESLGSSGWTLASVGASSAVIRNNGQERTLSVGGVF